MAERSHQVTRLEGFSDAVFGFALTLLVGTRETLVGGPVRAALDEAASEADDAQR